VKKILNSLIKYNDGEIELKVSLEQETIWLIAEDIASLFGVQRPAIVKHIGNIYKDEELIQTTTCSKMEQIAKDGKKRKINYYNLDIIISVGYRVNSKKATKFRQWATSVLKNYISDAYAINTHKLTEQRLVKLENDMEQVKSNIQNITLEIKQGIFYDGQIFDAYIFVNDLFKSAKEEVLLIDNYIDETTLILLSKYSDLKFTIITKNLSKQLKLDMKKYNSQYDNLDIKISNKYHDRFLIIDNKTAYHIGASLKDLGNKIFAFNKIDITLIKEID